MAISPWIYAAHHLAAVDSAQYLSGDGALTTVGSSCTISSDATIGRNVLRLTSAFTNTASNLLMATKAGFSATELVMGFRYQMEQYSDFAGSAGVHTIVSFQGSAGELLNLAIERNSQRLYLRRGTTLLYNILSVPEAVWMYIEIYVKFHASTGFVQLRVNGVDALPMTTGLNTANVTVGTGCTSIDYRNMNGGSLNSRTRFTDWYLRDVPGVGDPFLGMVAPVWRAVTADVGSTGFTQDSGGNLYSRVATMTGYIQSAASADYVEFELAALPGGLSSVIGMIALTVAEAPSGGSPVMNYEFHYGSDTSTGNTASIATTPQTQAKLHLTQPNGTDWTLAAAAGGAGGSKLKLTVV